MIGAGQPALLIHVNGTVVRGVNRRRAGFGQSRKVAAGN
jgi:hypothetical protein